MHGLSPESEGYTNGTTTLAWFADIVYRGEVKLADFISPENKDRTEKPRNPYAPGPEGSVRTDTGKTKTVREHPAEKLLSGQAKPVRQRIRRRRLLRPRENRKQRPLSLREHRRQKLLRPSAKQNRKQLCPQTEPGRRLLQLQQKRKQKQLCPQTEPGQKGPCLQAKHKKKRRPAEPLRKNPFEQEKAVFCSPTGPSQRRKSELSPPSRK